MDKKQEQSPSENSEAADKKTTEKKSSKKIVNTNFGTVLENQSADQKKVLQNLIFAATAPSENSKIADSALGIQPTNGRTLPKNDIKIDHLLIKGISLAKNMQSGDWEISEITTNQGSFGTSKDQNERLNQKLLRYLAGYLKQTFEGDIKAFLHSEKYKR